MALRIALAAIIIVGIWINTHTTATYRAVVTNDAASAAVVLVVEIRAVGGILACGAWTTCRVRRTRWWWCCSRRAPAFVSQTGIVVTIAWRRYLQMPALAVPTHIFSFANVTAHTAIVIVDQ